MSLKGSEPEQNSFLHLWIESDTHDDRQDIIEALAEATDRGVIIVTCTQCSSGAVSSTSTFLV